MHILVIPSERLVPADNKLEGIFPYHQAVALSEAGYRVGSLSIGLSFSVPMVLKGSLLKLLKQKAGNASDNLSFFALLKLGFNKFFFPEKFIKKEALSGVTVYRIDGFYRRPPVANKNHFSWVKAGQICFDAYVKENGRPDLVHAHEAIYAGMLAETLYRKFKVPYIITEHSTFYATGSPDDEIIMRVKKSHQHAAALFAVSQSFATFLNERFSTNRFDYLPNVLDPQLEAAPCKSKNKKNGFHFLNLALCKPVKDQETLLKAFALTAGKNPNVELRIGGKGDLFSRLTGLAEELGIEKKVRFLGELYREQVIDELNNCDCFVLSSKYETFGVVLIEAMLFGKPVVSTAVGIAPEIINARTGYLVNTGDEKALAGAMIKIIERESAYEGNHIRRFTISHFGRQAFIERINKIYREVV